MLPRLMAVVALVAGAAAVVLLLTLGGGGDDWTPHRNSYELLLNPPRTVQRLALPKGVEAVRNASPQPDWHPYSGPVPILRYHVVAVAPPATSLTELFVPPVDFRAQMDWLEAHGYEAVGLETVEHAWFDGGTLPAKPIVLTFDGGPRHLLDVVEPDLRRRGWPADLVVDTEAPLPRPGSIARLIALGWDVEPSGVDPIAARNIIRARLPTPATNFAYRQGVPPSSRIRSVKRAGFTGATTPGGGFAEPSDPFALPRITIFNASRIDGFAEAIRSHGEGVGA
jgi:hypothetical protein